MIAYIAKKAYKLDQNIKSTKKSSEFLGMMDKDINYHIKDIQGLPTDNDIHNLRNKRRIQYIPTEKKSKKRSKTATKKSTYINLAGTKNARSEL